MESVDLEASMKILIELDEDSVILIKQNKDTIAFHLEHLELFLQKLKREVTKLK